MKLLLFDIDGTLMFHVGRRSWNEQYAHGMKVAFGITQPIDFSTYNGSIERHMAWEIVRKHHISKEEFFAKFSLYTEAMMIHLADWAKEGPVFQAIDEAATLVRLLSTHKNLVLGILTGNAQSIARWKLSHVGLDMYFSFGLYGEEADNRIELAKLVFEKAQKQLHQEFAPQDIVVIGDTVHDIRCGKAIGARTIAVTTGMHNDPAVLQTESPDILVDSLADPRVEEVLLA